MPRGGADVFNASGDKNVQSPPSACRSRQTPKSQPSLTEMFGGGVFKLPAFAVGVCKLAGKISSRRGHIPSIPGDEGYNTLFCHIPVMYLKFASFQGEERRLCGMAKGWRSLVMRPLTRRVTSFCFLAALVKQ